MGLFSRKKDKPMVYGHLEKTKTGFGDKIKNLFSKSQFDGDFYEQLEESLITADVSVDTAIQLMNRFQKEVQSRKLKNEAGQGIKEFEKIIEGLIPDNNFDIEENQLNILFVFGINGVGKTTSISKLANKLNQEGLSIMVAAADTYRAAAVDQLDIWCQRAGVHLVKHEGKSKPSAVIFDAIDSALAKKTQVLIVDTAGRLHTKDSLMDELKKMDKILSTKAPNAKRYNLLVVDATTGQNAVSQAKNFHESVKINGVFLSKMDSTAKGGIAISLAHQLNIPVVFIGIGEKMEDIEYFDRHVFMESLLK